MDVAGGARYNFTGIQAVGIADVADSFAAIENAVKAGYSIDDVIEACRSDFSNSELHELHKLLENSPPNTETMLIQQTDTREWFLRCTGDEVNKYRNYRNGKFTAGYYPMTTNVGFGFFTSACRQEEEWQTPQSRGKSVYRS